MYKFVGFVLLTHACLWHLGNILPGYHHFFYKTVNTSIGLAIQNWHEAGWASPEVWRGLIVAPEQRCSNYDAKDYRFPKKLTAEIFAKTPLRFGPYTKTYFKTAEQAYFDHVVATSEAHDSGLCDAAPVLRSAFAKDSINITSASAKLVRLQKQGKDASEWVPKHNKCWFAHTVVRVKLAYGLTVDVDEKAALESILSRCTLFNMEI